LAQARPMAPFGGALPGMASPSSAVGLPPRNLATQMALAASWSTNGARDPSPAGVGRRCTPPMPQDGLPSPKAIRKRETEPPPKREASRDRAAAVRRSNTGPPVGSPVGTPGRVLRSISRGGLGEGPGSKRGDATAEKPVVTSASAPCTVTWLSSETASASCHLARFGMSVCPGKRINGRDGKVYARSLEEDLRQLRDDHNVTLLLNLLNESELRSLGVSLAEYKKHAAALGITLLQLPCIEMAPFDDPEKVWEVCNQVEEQLTNDMLCRVVVHCRGGVGRAGSFAACYLLHRMHEFARIVPGVQTYSPRDAIAHVRKRRCPRAVESRKQEDFVDTYAKLLLLRGLPTTPSVGNASTRPSTFESGVRRSHGASHEVQENFLHLPGVPALDLVECAE